MIFLCCICYFQSSFSIVYLMYVIQMIWNWFLCLFFFSFVLIMGMFVLRFLLILMLIDQFDLFFKSIDEQNWVSQSELFIEKTDDVIFIFVKIIEINEMLFMKNVWNICETEIFIVMIESMFEFEFKIIMLFMIILIVVLTIVFLSCASYFTLF